MGFAPVDGEVRVREEGRRSGRRSDKRITIVPSIFEGVIEITDPNQFRTALANGIGPAKAYGCGLLSIGPVQ